ncbi:MAG: ABC transporter ATP-binding protein [Acidobacteria bacterium]|nr:ABC transporter ATP-binding protein [Acidobacteriota bacterium]
MLKRTWTSAWPYLRRYKRGLALGFGALILKDLAAAAMPLLIREGVNALQQRAPLSKVFLIAGAMILLSATKGFFQYWMRIILVGISRDVEYDLRNDLFSKLTTLSQTFYGRMRTGDIMARATNDLNQVRMMLGPGAMYWFETMFLFLCAVVVMASVDWKLTLVSLAPAPLVSFVVIYFGRLIHARFEKIQEMFGDISSRVQENLSAIRILRAFRQEQAEITKFETLNKAYIAANLDLAWKTGLFMPLMSALIGMTFLIVLWAGGLRLLEGTLSLGSFVMFQTYLNMLIWPMIAFGWVINLTQRGTASLERIQTVLEEQPSIAAPANPQPLPCPVRGEIEFQGVTLKHGDREVLHNISLRLPAGETVAIVGHTGSGKSSLVSLIPRLWDATSGAVLLDGIDVRQLDPRALRGVIGLVPQETFLFSATLAENIAFGRPEAPPEAIDEAARLAGLETDISAFPDGLKTMIGERGITLSGGQKQRTAIARALILQPDILILDDALSSVDTLTEERILSALTEARRGRTTLLISHRVSTVRDAHLIYVIEDGRVAEQGTHAALIAQGGYYADLHQKQLLEDELARA